ncbi:MAG: DedA family protein [Acidobacteria bacterium]|nr:DedA family protein [Acidobacteriota bacterium]
MDGRVIRWYRSLYDWTLRWASTRSAGIALFLLALAESSFFPIPPDVLLMAIVLADRHKAWRAAGIATAGSVIGGLIGYLIGWAFWSTMADLFYRWVPGFTPEVYARVAEHYEMHNFWVVFVAGFTPIPYKVITIGAGVAMISLPIFFVASALSRGARFLLVAGLLYHFGPPIRRFLDRHLWWLTLLFVALLIGGFVVLTSLG